MSWCVIFLRKRLSKLRSTFRFFLAWYDRYYALCNNLVIEINPRNVISAASAHKIMSWATYVCWFKWIYSWETTVTINNFLFNWSVVLLNCILFRLLLALIFPLLFCSNLLWCIFLKKCSWRLLQNPCGYLHQLGKICCV